MSPKVPVLVLEIVVDAEVVTVTLVPFWLVSVRPLALTEVTVPDVPGPKAPPRPAGAPLPEMVVGEAEEWEVSAWTPKKAPTATTTAAPSEAAARRHRRRCGLSSVGGPGVWAGGSGGETGGVGPACGGTAPWVSPATSE
jgi:hypothetical protein